MVVFCKKIHINDSFVGFYNKLSFLFLVFVSLCIFSACGSGGSVSSGGNELTDVEGVILVDLVAVETGVRFEITKTDTLYASVAVGEQVYDDTENVSLFDFSFAMGMNSPLGLLDFEDE